MAFGDSCYENYEKAGEYMCNIFNEPFKAVLEPFDSIFGGAGELGFTIAIIWGIIIIFKYLYQILIPTITNTKNGILFL